MAAAELPAAVTPAPRPEGIPALPAAATAAIEHGDGRDRREACSLSPAPGGAAGQIVFSSGVEAMSGLRGSVIAIALLAVIGAGTAAGACEGSKVLFEDSFAELQPTWDVSPDVGKVEDGQLVITSKADWTVWVPSTASVYDDIDMCADVTTVAAIDPSTNYVGLVFWYQDDDNFYTVEISAAGTASMWRKQRGKWLEQFSWTKEAAVRGGDGTTNQLRVVTKGNDASFYVNGDKVAEIKGQPPQNGQQIGLIAYSPKKGVATYAFANVKITAPD
jgi:hypothetical protein